MKSSIKPFVIAIAALLAAGLIAWTGTFLYWHVKIKAAVHTVKEDLFSRHGDDALLTLKLAGCRTLPYLMSEVSTAENHKEMKVLGFMLYLCAADQLDSKGKEHLAKLCWIADEDAQEFAPRRDALLAWWKESGAEYHQWWRVWSSKCPKRSVAEQLR